MHRFIIRAPLCEGALIDFPAEEAAHAFKVLRLRAGEDIEVSDGEGALFAAELTEVSREIVRARLTERLDSKEPPVSLTLYMGYPKAEKLGLIVQVGRRDTVGKPALFGTTDRFLRQFGLHSLEELPEFLRFSQVEQTADEPAGADAAPSDAQPLQTENS